MAQADYLCEPQIAHAVLQLYEFVIQFSPPLSELAVLKQKNQFTGSCIHASSSPKLINKSFWEIYANESDFKAIRNVLKVSKVLTEITLMEYKEDLVHFACD
jgi:hypothetical protein